MHYQVRLYCADCVVEGLMTGELLAASFATIREANDSGEQAAATQTCNAHPEERMEWEIVDQKGRTVC
jgi:hypothetical protein